MFQEEKQLSLVGISSQNKLAVVRSRGSGGQ